MFLTTIGVGEGEGGGGVTPTPGKHFFNFLTLLMKMIFSQKNLNYFGFTIILSLVVTLSIIIK